MMQQHLQMRSSSRGSAARLRGSSSTGAAAKAVVVARRAAPPQRPQQRRNNAAACRAALLPELPDATTVAYWSIGAAGLSFVGTFFVAPLFKSSFKEDADWQTIYKELIASGGVPAVEAEAAYARRKTCDFLGRCCCVVLRCAVVCCCACRGLIYILSPAPRLSSNPLTNKHKHKHNPSTPIIDVRLANKYEKAHAEGARSLPLYIPIQGFGPAATIRRAAFAFFGLYGTELNTSFSADARALIPSGREVTLICETGGALENKSGTKFGFQSRSLKAAYFLRRAGYRVTYVRGGLAQWCAAGLPLEEGADDDGRIEPALEERASAGGGVGGLFAGLKLPALPVLGGKR
jgi:rhodanese-related sulfurtransferase